MRRFEILAIALLCAGLPSSGQRYDSARTLVQRVQDDLQRVKSLGPRNKKEADRLDNALKHLSDFDRNLSRNKFNKGRLNESIDDVKNVLKNDTLQVRDRDALNQDLNELRQLREVR